MTAAMLNLHLTLPEDTHRDLKKLSTETHRPLVDLAREFVTKGLKDARRARIAAEIAAYAEEMAGTNDDLDTDLEAAGLEAIAERD